MKAKKKNKKNITNVSSIRLYSQVCNRQSLTNTTTTNLKEISIIFHNKIFC